MPLTQPGLAMAEGLRGPRLQLTSSALCVSLTQDKKDSYEPVCNIPVITSLKEEERLIESSTKVMRPRGWPAGMPGTGPGLTPPSLTARGEAAVQQKQQQVLLHQVGLASAAEPGAGIQKSLKAPGVPPAILALTVGWELSEPVEGSGRARNREQRRDLQPGPAGP